jgi:hypothetical protein
MPLTNLRPIFYRVEEVPKVRSGWINPATGNISDVVPDNEQAVAIVARAKPAFAMGQRVEFSGPLDLYPVTTILRGERAIVQHHDEETGVVELFLEQVHNGLADNTLTVEPFHDEHVLECLRPLETLPVSVPLKGAPRVPSALWVLGPLLAATVAAVSLAQLGVSNGALAFPLAVIATAIVLGAKEAMIASVLSAAVVNLLMTPPMLHWSPLDAEQFFRLAVYLIISLAVPYLCSNSKRIRAKLVEVEGESEKPLATKS